MSIFHYKHRNAHLMPDLVYRGSEQDIFQYGMTVGTHHEQVGAELVHDLGDDVFRVPEAQKSAGFKPLFLHKRLVAFQQVFVLKGFVIAGFLAKNDRSRRLYTWMIRIFALAWHSDNAWRIACPSTSLKSTAMAMRE